MKHWIAGIATVFGFLAAAPTSAQPNEPDYPEPPAFIAERIVDGRFELGDFAYLRGYFPEASEAEKAQYAEMADWLDQCFKEGRARLDAELAKHGVELGEDSWIGIPNLCGQVVSGGQFDEFASFDEFTKALRSARLVFDTLVQSVIRAEQRAGPASEGDLGGELHQRTMSDQMLRGAFRWGWMETTEPRVPKMLPLERRAFIALLNSELFYTDHSNTQWLKQIVDAQGWPKISQVGGRGASAAWLLTQHADQDPLFQLRALRLMEPLLQEDEVSRTSYAFLYDRIMLKLAGKQRFGTQYHCIAGAREPLPLEEPERVDELRAEMGMETIAERVERFSNPCPA